MRTTLDIEEDALQAAKELAVKEEQAATGWASCPLSGNAVVRIMSHPSYSAMRRFNISS